LMDRSLQAQFLIPMATSLAFGVMFATIVTLYLIPCAMIAADDIYGVLAHAKEWYFRPFASAKKSSIEAPDLVSRT
jgi:hypothetical protein